MSYKYKNQAKAWVDKWLTFFPNPHKVRVKMKPLKLMNTKTSFTFGACTTHPNGNVDITITDISIGLSATCLHEVVHSYVHQLLKSHPELANDPEFNRINEGLADGVERLFQFMYDRVPLENKPEIII